MLKKGPQCISIETIGAGQTNNYVNKHVKIGLESMIIFISPRYCGPNRHIISTTKGLEEAATYRSDLRVVADESIQAVEALRRTNNQLQHTTSRWTQQAAQLHERGQDATGTYESYLSAAQAGCAAVYAQLSINARAASVQAQQTRHTFIAELNQIRSSFEHIRM